MTTDRTRAEIALEQLLTLHADKAEQAKKEAYLRGWFIGQLVNMSKSAGFKLATLDAIDLVNNRFRREQ